MYIFFADKEKGKRLANALTLRSVKTALNTIKNSMDWSIYLKMYLFYIFSHVSALNLFLSLQGSFFLNLN